MVRKQKVLIDTDPGIDDAMAIFMALAAHKKGQIQIMAITLVTGNTDIDKCKINITRILHAVNMIDEIPVYEGAKSALVRSYVRPHLFHGKDGFNDVTFEALPGVSKIRTGAVPAILDLVAKHPHEMTIIALGPLTNLAACINVDQDFTRQLAGLELMGGNVEGMGNITTCSEFNFHADPEAAYVVINRWEGPTCIKMVPWETCRNTYLDWTWRMDVLGTLGTPQMDILNRTEDAWYQAKFFGEQYIQCDQLTMACFLQPDIVKSSQHYHATVSLDGGVTRGMLILEKRDYLQGGSDLQKLDTQKVEIIQSLDVGDLKDLLVRSLGLRFD